MKYIFLDVDGVLNSSERWDDCHLVSQDRLSKIDDRAVFRLLKIVEQTGAVCVISSTWRLYDDMLTGLCETLFEVGIDVVGYTSDLREIHHGQGTDRSRAYEIRKWLIESGDCEAFVIIDDDLDARIEDHYVGTMFETGLLDQHIERAIRILNM